MLRNSNRRAWLRLSLALVLLSFACVHAVAQRGSKAGAQRVRKAGVQRIRKAGAPTVLERDVRAHEEFLASDAMQGRGSGTQFELLAGVYVGAQLRQFGVEPAGDADATGQKTYIQTVDLTRPTFASAPTLTFGTGGAAQKWTHGQEIIVPRTNAARVSGALQKLTASQGVKPGAFVLYSGEGAGDMRQVTALARALWQQGAAAVLVAEVPAWRQRWAASGARLPQLPAASDANDGTGALVVLSTDAFKTLQQASDGTPLTLEGEPGAAQSSHTYNAVGVLRGSDPKLASEVILLTAHMDHLGVAGDANGQCRNTLTDTICNGADDDASGVVAVLELARVLGAGARPKRTVYFVTFGSEERGGFGAQYFLAHPPVPLSRMIANLEFEMIGRPDPKVDPGTLWLTGYDRSNLGAELAKQGARLVADPHPEQNFFQRSDNYALARRGVVAHTVSSYGLHPEYHQPTDDLAHLNIAHMTRAINSMVQPVIWLVNSDFKPAWVAGGKP
jgi:aminopeptidase YwaD